MPSAPESIFAGMTMTDEHCAVLKKAVAVSGAGKATAILKAHFLWDEQPTLRKWEFEIEETRMVTVVIAAATKEEARRWIHAHDDQYLDEDSDSDVDVSFIRERNQKTPADDVVETPKQRA